MNPILFWRLITGLVSIIAAGATWFGQDQNSKRKLEQKKNRSEIDDLEQKLIKAEALLDQLEPKLGKSHVQIRALAAEINRLNTIIAEHYSVAS